MDIKLKKTIESKGTKECISCKETKDLNEFYIHLRYKDGREKKCKLCKKIDRLLQ